MVFNWSAAVADSSHKLALGRVSEVIRVGCDNLKFNEPFFICCFGSLNLKLVVVRPKLSFNVAASGAARCAGLLRSSYTTVVLVMSYQRVAFADIDSAPESPGLYAWYGVLRSGKGTWGADYCEGADQGEARSRRALQLHTEHFANAPLSIAVKSAFSASWTGVIGDDAGSSMRAVLDLTDENTIDESDRKNAPKLQASLHAPRMRELLFSMLERSTPVVSAPLYIGVAQNLRERLQKHAHNIMVHSRRASATSAYFDNVTEPSVLNSFAFRAAKQGFSSDNLEVWLLEPTGYDESKMDLTQLREVAEACEWLLNRWHRPPLGRR